MRGMKSSSPISSGLRSTKIVEMYKKMSSAPVGVEEILIDSITDLLHACDQRQLDPKTIMEIAFQHFSDEKSTNWNNPRK